MTTPANPPALDSGAVYRRRWWRRCALALRLCLGSAGWRWWQACRIVAEVARRAPCFAEGAILVVPGYRLDEDAIPPPYASRLQRALRLWRPEGLLLLSGTAATLGDQSEALAGYAFLRDAGLPATARVVLDPHARDTDENLRMAAHWLRSATAGEVVVISNRWHLARIAWLLRRHGLAWKVCAAERRWRPDGFARLALLREGLALLAYAGGEVARLQSRRLLELP